MGYGFVPNNTNIIEYYMTYTFYSNINFFFFKTARFQNFLKMKYLKSFDSINFLNFFFKDYKLSNTKKTIPILFFNKNDFSISFLSFKDVFFFEELVSLNLNKLSIIINEIVLNHKNSNKVIPGFWNYYISDYPKRVKKTFDFFLVELFLLNELISHFLHLKDVFIGSVNYFYDKEFIILNALFLDLYNLSKNLLFKIHKILAFYSIVPKQVLSFLKIRYNISIYHINLLANFLEKFIECSYWYSFETYTNFQYKSILNIHDLISYIKIKNNFSFKSISYLITSY